MYVQTDFCANIALLSAHVRATSDKTINETHLYVGEIARAAGDGGRKRGSSRINEFALTLRCSRRVIN